MLWSFWRKVQIRISKIANSSPSSPILEVVVIKMQNIYISSNATRGSGAKKNFKSFELTCLLFSNASLVMVFKWEKKHTFKSTQKAQG